MRECAAQPSRFGESASAVAICCSLARPARPVPPPALAHALPPGLLPRPQYFITGCLGITLSYHRQLSHRSFTTPKWLEYVFAYCGVMAVQGDPLEWVSAP